MTKEELEEKFMRLMTRFVRDAGYSTRQAISDIESLLASQKSREIPPPPLKWEGDSERFTASFFGLKFSVFLSRRGGGRYAWIASIYGMPVLMSNEFDAEEKNEAIAWCEAKWKEIWEKEMGQAI